LTCLNETDSVVQAARRMRAWGWPPSRWPVPATIWSAWWPTGPDDCW